MSESAETGPATGLRFERWAPVILLACAFAAYAAIALGTGQAQYLTLDNLTAILAGRSRSASPPSARPSRSSSPPSTCAWRA